MQPILRCAQVTAAQETCLLLSQAIGPPNSVSSTLTGRGPFSWGREILVLRAAWEAGVLYVHLQAQGVSGPPSLSVWPLEFSPGHAPRHTLHRN